MEIREITGPESLEAWLKDKPPEWAQVIALRTALRVMPLVFPVVGLIQNDLEKLNRLDRIHSKFVVSAFRACTILKYTVSYYDTVLEHVRQAAFNATREAFGSDIALGLIAARAVDAARNATSTTYAQDVVGTAKFIYAGDITFASSGASLALSHANRSAESINVDLIKPLQMDAEWLEGYGNQDPEAAQALAGLQLWFGDGAEGTGYAYMPGWAEERLVEFEESNLARSTSFGLIAHWYRSAASGTSAFEGDRERTVVLMSSEDWGDSDKEYDPISVMDRVARLLDWDSKKPDERAASMPSAAVGNTKNAILKQKILENRQVLLFNTAALQLQIVEFRERVRSSNTIAPEFRDELLLFLDHNSTNIDQLIEALPETDEVEPADDDVAKASNFLADYYSAVKNEFPKYFDPQHLGEVSVPTGIILLCSGIGALLGGPIGFGAGGYVGRLVTKEVKPGKLADKLEGMLQEDTKSEDHRP